MNPEDALNRAAAAARTQVAGEIPIPGDVLAELLDAAVDAFPIDHTEPPRNPRDQLVRLHLLNLADAINQGEL